MTPSAARWPIAAAEVEFRYGVEDLDPMDAQALLTPDAVERYMGVPLAHVPAPEGSPHPTTPATSPGLFLETFATWASTRGCTG
jgi:hypothetical protein